MKRLAASFALFALAAVLSVFITMDCEAEVILAADQRLTSDGGLICSSIDACVPLGTGADMRQERRLLAERFSQEVLVRLPASESAPNSGTSSSSMSTSTFTFAASFDRPSATEPPTSEFAHWREAAMRLPPPYAERMLDPPRDLA